MLYDFLNILYGLYFSSKFAPIQQTSHKHNYWWRMAKCHWHFIETGLCNCQHLLTTLKICRLVEPKFLRRSTRPFSLPSQIRTKKRSGNETNCLLWYSGFLTCQLQCAVVNGSHFCWLPVRLGVLQGSILGPLLLIISVNVIYSIFHKQCRWYFRGGGFYTSHLWGHPLPNER